MKFKKKQHVNRTGSYIDFLTNVVFGDGTVISIGISAPTVAFRKKRIFHNVHICTATISKAPRNYLHSFKLGSE